MRKLGFWSALVAAVAVVATVAATALAATTVRVTQNDGSWTQDDTRGGGTVTWTGAYGAPSGLGSSSLQLATTASTADKAGLYTHTMAGTPLADVTDLSYYTYQPAGNAPFADASYQLQVDTGCGFTTLVFEPYENVAQGPIVANTWQKWDVDNGLFWSSRTVACGTSTLVAGAGGAPFYTLAQVKAMFPNAVVVGIGVNVGTFNPGYTVAVDGVQFNDTIYNFEIGTRPTTKDQCKNGGWATFDDPAFKNQGDCVSYVATHGKNPGNG
jgi:hypothetical protein